MRFRGENQLGQLGRIALVLMTTTTLASCGGIGGARPATSVSSLLPANGPQADYPVVIGAPYAIDGTSYAPADVLNYDEVGYLAAGTGAGITGAHHTLPFPSYVEVTSLESGRTILVRLEQRGPMDSNHLLALSPAALDQIGAHPDAPIRVRRVNPPENQRALLRDHQAAPLRMDTPMGLVEVLRRRLPEEGSVSLRAAADHVSEVAPLANNSPATIADPATAATTATAPALPPIETVVVEPSQASPPTFDPEDFDEAFSNARPSAEVAVEASAPEPATAAARATPRVTDGFVVQAATFSTRERANNAASALGGAVTQIGSLFRVRTGPFVTRAQAEASLANVRAAGYSDARIYTTG